MRDFPVRHPLPEKLHRFCHHFLNSLGPYPYPLLSGFKPCHAQQVLHEPDQPLYILADALQQPFCRRFVEGMVILQQCACRSGDACQGRPQIVEMDRSSVLRRRSFSISVLLRSFASK